MPPFQMLSAARSLELIHAWANAPWPITWDHAFTIAADLGWRQDSEEPRYYFGDLATDDIDCVIGQFNGEPGWVNFPLTDLAQRGCEAETGLKTRLLFAAINEVLEAEYGASVKRVGATGIESFEWPLASGATLRIALDDRFLDVTINSPAQTALYNDPRADPNPDEDLS